MSELDISPVELFSQNSSKIINICINGIDTKSLELNDNHGNYLAIIALDKSFSDICGQIIHNHWIKEVDYVNYQGKIMLIKAYY